MASFTTQPLPGTFGLEIQSVDVSSPDFSDEDLRTLLQTLYDNQLIVLRDQHLTSDRFVAFAERIGEPIPHVLAHKRLPGYPGILPLTNVIKEGQALTQGAAQWHSDQSYEKEPSSVTMLYSLQAPEKGGETRLCNMKRAYEALPEETKEDIVDYQVEHLYGTGIAARPEDTSPAPLKGQEQVDAVPPVYHPLVRSHPVTGEKTLYSVAGTSRGIKGMAVQEAKKLLCDLSDHAFQEQFLTKYRHRVHDLVLWDNPTTMHTATPINAATGPHDTRLIHRISVKGIPSVFQN